MIHTKLVSSLEKCFLDDDIDSFSPLSSISILRNERLSVQLLHTNDTIGHGILLHCKLELGGTLAPYAGVRKVDQVPVILPAYPQAMDDNYLRKSAGLYPDILSPLHYHDQVSVLLNMLGSIWIEIDPRSALAAGQHDLTVTLIDGKGNRVAEEHLSVEILDAELPESDMTVTQWFYCDCLADYYRCEPWSEEHWRIVENFAATAVRNGINMLLTPIHTPPLDTYEGGERTTVQLIDVRLTNGEYSFDFSKLDRWIDMCNRVGIKYFEIAHLFTQWGAEHAPKIMATVDGVYRRLFGWQTGATDPEYVRYLHTMLPALLAHMKARGDDQRCFFHISDEPHQTHVKGYSEAKAAVGDLLKGYTVMDALSNVEYWKSGMVEKPIPSSTRIGDFVEAGASELWTYYCCSQGKDVSNRFIAMPLWRTRCIGLQFYKYDICGFLHWGYNFYNNQCSVDHINPFGDVSGEFSMPAGDTHSVYPDEDGNALESMRIISFYEALQDLRAMKLAERYHGKERVIRELEEILGEEIKFNRCVKDSATMLALRMRINDLIREKLKEN